MQSGTTINRQSFSEDPVSQPEKNPSPLEALAVDSFVKVKFIYNEGKKSEHFKYFIGKIIEKQIIDNSCTIKFMRNSSKDKNLYVFPQVDDILEINKNYIVGIMLPDKIVRGNHYFKD